MAQNEWAATVTARIGRNISRARKRNGWSAEQLSAATEEAGFKIARQVIANIENGRRESIGIAELMVFAEVLGTSSAELVFPSDALMDSFPVSPKASDNSFRARLKFTGRAMLKTDWDPKLAESEVFEDVLLIHDMEELANRSLYQLLLAQAEGDEEEISVRQAQLRARIAKGLKLVGASEIPDASLPQHEAQNLISMAQDHAPELLEEYGFTQTQEKG